MDEYCHEWCDNDGCQRCQAECGEEYGGELWLWEETGGCDQCFFFTSRCKVFDFSFLIFLNF